MISLLDWVKEFDFVYTKKSESRSGDVAKVVSKIQFEAYKAGRTDGLIEALEKVKLEVSRIESLLLELKKEE